MTGKPIVNVKGKVSIIGYLAESLRVMAKENVPKETQLEMVSRINKCNTVYTASVIQGLANSQGEKNARKYPIIKKDWEGPICKCGHREDCHMTDGIVDNKPGKWCLTCADDEDMPDDEQCNKFEIEEDW